MEKRFRYPRTLHLPWSEHVTTDDKVMSHKDVARAFQGKEVIVTEKMDGENLSMYHDYTHARAINGRYHPSRSWVRNIHATIKDDIFEGWRICGENMYACHSIFYRNLETYLYVFAVFDSNNHCLNYDDMVEYIKAIDPNGEMLSLPPVLYRGEWDEEQVKKCFTGKSFFEGSEDIHGRDVSQEGYVVRTIEGFDYPKSCQGERLCFSQLAKFVREKHVISNEHWMHGEIVPNEFKVKL